MVVRSPLSLMSTCLLDNFDYILNTFKHFIFLCHCSQLLVHPCSQSTRRCLSKLPLFYSSCPILLRKPVFISSLPSSREGIIHFFPIADTPALWALLSNLMRLFSSGQRLLTTANIQYGLNLAESHHTDCSVCLYSFYISRKKDIHTQIEI